MSGLNYIGPAPVDPEDVANRLQLNSIIDTAAVNRTAVASQALTEAGNYASKTYVDTQDALFASDSYYQQRDGLNIPLSAKGVAGGVATLDGSAEVPIAQMPVLGASYVKGPYGATAVTLPVQAGSEPVKFADFNIGPAGIQFRPLVFLSALVAIPGNAQPIIEVCLSDGEADYDSSTLVAMGVGRSFYDDPHTVTVLPVPATTGSSPGSYPTTYNVWLSAYLYSGGQDATILVNHVVAPVAFLLRVAE